MMRERRTHVPAVPAPLRFAVAPVDVETERGIRPVGKACQLHQYRTLFALRPDNQRFAALKAFPVIQQRRQPGAVIRVNMGEVNRVDSIHIKATLPQRTGDRGAAINQPLSVFTVDHAQCGGILLQREGAAATQNIYFHFAPPKLSRT